MGRSDAPRESCVSLIKLSCACCWLKREKDCTKANRLEIKLCTIRRVSQHKVDAHARQGRQHLAAVAVINRDARFFVVRFHRKVGVVSRARREHFQHSPSSPTNSLTTCPGVKCWVMIVAPHRVHGCVSSGGWGSKSARAGSYSAHAFAFPNEAGEVPLSIEIHTLKRLS